MAQEQRELLDVGAVLQGHLGEGRRRAAGEAPLGCRSGCKTHRFGRFSGLASRFRIYDLEGRVGLEPTTPGPKVRDPSAELTTQAPSAGIRARVPIDGATPDDLPRKQETALPAALATHAL